MNRSFIFVGVFLLGLVCGVALPFRVLDVQEFREKAEMTAHTILLDVKEIWFDDLRNSFTKFEAGETGMEECDS